MQYRTPLQGLSRLFESSITHCGVQQTSEYHSVRYYDSHHGALGGTMGAMPRISAHLSMLSKRGGRKSKVVLGIVSRVLRGRILHFELKLQLTIRRFQCMPWLGCSMTIINQLPSNAPIFTAYRYLDFGSVRSLLESRTASIHDRFSDRMGLLEASNKSSAVIVCFGALWCLNNQSR